MNTNIKCLRVISIVIMAALVCAVLTGCGEPCSCSDTAHLDYDATCGCGGKGCNCTPKVIARIGTVPVYKKSDASNTGAAINRINSAYSDVDPVKFSSSVKAVVIVSGNTAGKAISDGKWVITVGETANLGTIGPVFDDCQTAPTVTKAHDGWTKLNRQVIANGNHNVNKVMFRVHA